MLPRLEPVIDREKDRLNPRTRNRPLASGALPVWIALVAFVGLVVGALWGSYRLGPACVWVIVTYSVMNILYSVRLKRTVIADVMCIALGFVFRVMYGAYAVQAVPTAWVVLCMFFLALVLGFAKRKAELASSLAHAHEARHVLTKYNLGYLDLLLGMCATMTIVSYALFTVTAHKNETLVVTIVPVVYCVIRYLHQVIVEGRGGAPEEVLLTDRMLCLGILVWLVATVFILYTDFHIFDGTMAGPPSAHP